MLTTQQMSEMDKITGLAPQPTTISKKGSSRFNELEQIASNVEPVTFSEKLKKSLGERSGKVTQSVKDVYETATDKNLPMSQRVIGGIAEAGQVPLRTLGQAAGAIGDVATEGLNVATGGGVDKLSNFIASTENGKKLGTALSRVKSEHPELYDALGDIINIAGVGTGGLATKSLGTATKDLTKSTVAKTLDGATSLLEKGKGVVSSGDPIIDMITPQLSVKDSVSALKSGKVVENKGFTGGRDITSTVPNFEDIRFAVERVPGINPKGTNLENLNVIHDEIGTLANNLTSKLDADKRFFSPTQFKGYMDTIKKEISESPLLVGDAEKSAQKIYNKFESFVKQEGYTPSGLLKARKKLDQWIELQKGEGIFDPTKETTLSTVLRGVRQGGNNFLAELVPDINVKEALKNQSLLYQAIENIAPKAAKEGGNKIQRLLVRSPRLQKALELGAASVIGGGAAGVILNK